MPSLHCEWACVLSNMKLDQMTFGIGHKRIYSFFAVGDHVSLQMSYLTKWLLAFWASVGFSPLWMSMCVFKVPARPNNFLHSEQICIFSPLWVSLCWFRCPAEPNDFLHWTQLNILSLLWVSIRLFRISGQPNDFWHPAQLCIFFLRWAVSLSFGVDL